VSFWQKLFGVTATPPESARELGRNAPCWCGSDKKYKHCHYKSDRDFFTAKQNAACKGPT